MLKFVAMIVAGLAILLSIIMVVAMTTGSGSRVKDSKVPVPTLKEVVPARTPST